MIVLFALVTPLSAAGPGEYQVKAVFLFNFSQFVEWPAHAFVAPNAPFVICTVGQDRFGADLDAAARGESVQDHPLLVKHYRSTDSIDSCHIVFIGDSEQTQLDAILKEAQRNAVLTVSDIEHSAEHGTIIQFVSESNRLRLRINVNAAKAAGLTISSKLLRPAEIVGAAPG